MEDTNFYRIQAEKAKTTDGLKNNVINQLENDKKRWKEWIRDIVDKNGGPKNFAESLGGNVTESAVKNWIYRGNYPERDNSIRIGFLLGYTQGEINKFLQRNGGYMPFNIKVLEDCVYIFVLEKLGLRGMAGYQKSRELIDRLNGNSKSNDETGENTIEETVVFWEKFENVHEIEELEDFIYKNVDGIKKRNIRLKKQIEKYLQYTIEGYQVHGYKYTSIHKLCIEQKWPKRMEEMYSKIKNYSWNISTKNARESLIALCILLNMNIELMNETLSMVGMEPLGAKNRVESVIIHVLTEAEKRGIIEVEVWEDRQERYGAQKVCSILIAKFKELHLQEETMAKKLIEDLEGCAKSMEEAEGWIFSNKEEGILVLEDNSLFFYSLEGRESVIVGRKTDSRRREQPDLGLKSTTVGRKHGKFIKRGTEWFYTDLMSNKNPSLVNGEVRNWIGETTKTRAVRLRKVRESSLGREEYDNYDVNILGINAKKGKMVLMIYIGKDFYFNKWCIIPLNLNGSIEGIRVKEDDNHSYKGGIQIYCRGGKYYIRRYGKSGGVSINQEDIYLNLEEEREIKNMDKIKFFEADKLIIFTKKTLLIGKFTLL